VQKLPAREPGGPSFGHHSLMVRIGKVRSRSR
jgi:hypothetical protein